MKTPLSSAYPELASEWHPTKNEGLSPSEVSSGSGSKVWWMGKCGHEWQATVGSRAKLGRSCPYCSGNSVLIGFNDLSSTHPVLASEWHPTKNGELTPRDFSSGSGRKVWWLCGQGHEWEAVLSSRALTGNGCPVCAGKALQVGFNDLLTTNPNIAKEWHPTKNGGLSPTSYTQGSKTKVWWLGECGHEWQTAVGHRTKSNSGCPYCSGNLVLPGFNDLETNFPELAEEWDSEKNSPLTPQEVTKGSGLKVWWNCEFGHSFEQIVAARTSKNSGCPVCAGKRVLKGHNDFETLSPLLASEWHPTKNGELTPDSVSNGSGKKVWWLGPCGHSYQSIVNSRTSRGDGCPVCVSRTIVQGINDLSTKRPELALQWHPTKNGNLSPFQVASSSHTKVWWLCDNGHEWEATINKRQQGNNCPVCAGSSVLKGFNDLQSCQPKLAGEWDSEKNVGLSPEMVTIGSGLKVWWKCDLGHEFKSQIAARVYGVGCPVCSGTKFLQGFNDLQTRHPSLAAEWHPAKNGNLAPSEVHGGVPKKFWWLGKCGHEWEQLLTSRVEGRGCPICVGKQILIGFNDFQTLEPELASEWHPTKNRNFTPQQVTIGSSKKVWWLGKCGHEWPTTIPARLGGSNCPKCSIGGFRSTDPAILYFIEHPNLKAFKVGITNSERKVDRLEVFSRQGWKVIQKWENPLGLVVRNAETEFFRWLRVENNIPTFLGEQEMKITAGASETFSDSAFTKRELISKIEAILDSVNSEI